MDKGPEQANGERERGGEGERERASSERLDTSLKKLRK